MFSREKNMKKVLSLIFALLLVVPSIFIFSACGEDKTPQDSITVESLQKVYYLNEQLSCEGAVLKYTYDGREVVVDVNADMISGFTTSSAGEKSCYISYQDKIIKFNYTVLNLVGNKFVHLKNVDASNNETGSNSEVLLLNKDYTFSITNKYSTIKGQYTILPTGDITLTHEVQIDEENKETQTMRFTKENDMFILSVNNIKSYYKLSKA